MFTLELNLMDRELTIAFSSFIVTTILTVIIIWHTVKNARKQMDNDSKSLEMHTKSIWIANYSYRMECIKYLDEVMKFGSIISGLKYRESEVTTNQLMLEYINGLSTQIEEYKYAIISLFENVSVSKLNELILNMMKLKECCMEFVFYKNPLNPKVVKEIVECALQVVATTQELKIEMREQMIYK